MIILQIAQDLRGNETRSAATLKLVGSMRIVVVCKAEIAEAKGAFIFEQYVIRLWIKLI